MVAETIAETELRARGSALPAITRTRLDDHAQLLNTNLPNLMTLGLFQVGFGLALTSLLGLRNSGMLRQIRSAGCSARTVVCAVVTSNLVVAGAQVVLLAVVGTRLAGASGDPLALAGIALLTFVTMSAIGVTVASLGKTLQTVTIAAGVSGSLLALLALIPIPNIKNATAQNLMSLTPTGAASEAFRAALHGPDHRPLAAVVAVLLGWCLIFVLFAAKTFRWDRITA